MVFTMFRFMRRIMEVIAGKRCLLISELTPVQYFRGG